MILTPHPSNFQNLLHLTHSVLKRYSFRRGALLLGLSAALIPLTAWADWEEWEEEEEEVYIAPMIEASQGLNSRANGAFQDLGTQFNDSMEDFDREFDSVDAPRPHTSDAEYARRAEQRRVERVRRVARKRSERERRRIERKRSRHQRVERRLERRRQRLERRRIKRQRAARRHIDRRHVERDHHERDYNERDYNERDYNERDHNERNSHARDSHTRRSVEPKRRTPRAAGRRRAAPASGEGFTARVLELVNQERARGGVCGGRSFPPAPPLRAHRKLDRAAEQHGHAMAQRGFFDHKGPDGDTPQSRIKDAGYAGQAWGENIAAGQRSPESVMRAWMKSPGHCSNILNPLFTELGVSYLRESQSEYKTYWVQAFGRPMQ